MKIVQIGCNHAGTWSAKTILKKKNPEDELIVFDRNDNISFLGCGIALWVSGVVKDPNTLFYASVKELEDLGAKIHIKHDVTSVDVKNKIVKVKDLTTGKEFEESFDKLIVATGSWPIIPPIKGIDTTNNVVIAKIYQHAQNIIEKIKDPNIKKVAIIGAGYIGVELAEAFDQHGKETYLIEMQDRVTANVFDKDMAIHMEDAIKENSFVNLRLNEQVQEFVANEKGDLIAVKTDKGSYDVDMAIVCIGFRPVHLFNNGEFELAPNKSIVVNEFFQTSNPDIFAIGDSVAQTFNVDNSKKGIMLASNAVKSGVVAGINILKDKSYPFRGIQGTNAIHVFNFTMSGVGLTETQIKAMPNGPKNIGTLIVEDYDKPDFIEEREKVWLKAVYDKDTKEILGMQIASKANHAYETYMLSLALEQKATIDQIGMLDIYFLPHFNKPVNIFLLLTLKYLEIV